MSGVLPTLDLGPPASSIGGDESQTARALAMWGFDDDDDDNRPPARLQQQQQQQPERRATSSLDSGSAMQEQQQQQQWREAPRVVAQVLPEARPMHMSPLVLGPKSPPISPLPSATIIRSDTISSQGRHGSAVAMPTSWEAVAVTSSRRSPARPFREPHPDDYNPDGSPRLVPIGSISAMHGIFDASGHDPRASLHNNIRRTPSSNTLRSQASTLELPDPYTFEANTITRNSTVSSTFSISSHLSSSPRLGPQHPNPSFLDPRASIGRSSSAMMSIDMPSPVSPSRPLYADPDAEIAAHRADKVGMAFLDSSMSSTQQSSSHRPFGKISLFGRKKE